MLALALLLACGEPPQAPEPPPAPAPVPRTAPAAPRSVVILLADDMGVDAIAAYADDPLAATPTRPFPPTPTLDGLCDEGVRFRTAWATPVCSPTRAAMLTGRYGFRTGVDKVRGVSISATETTLPGSVDVPTAQIGKWHLGHGDDLGGISAPNRMGWDHFSGTLDNIGSYTKWTRVRDGESQAMTGYATSVQVDDAIEWWAAHPGGPKVLQVSFTAPHAPFHEPPEDLGKASGSTVGQRYDAALVALDAEIGRLLEAVGDEVVVVFLGDNGTPNDAIRGPFPKEKGKGSLFEGGVRVPMCARGPGVGTGVHEGPVHAVDVFATAVSLVGGELPPDRDAIDLTPVLAAPGAEPVREWVYTESDRSTEHSPAYDGGYALRDQRYKYARLHSGREWLFDLDEDPLETEDRSGDPALAETLARFRARAEELRGPPPAPIVRKGRRRAAGASR